MKQPKPCGEKCAIFSRIVGYYRNIGNWNIGKKQEFKERKTFNIGGEKPREANNEEHNGD